MPGTVLGSFCLDFAFQKLQSFEGNGVVDKCYKSLWREALKDSGGTGVGWGLAVPRKVGKSILDEGAVVLSLTLGVSR